MIEITDEMVAAFRAAFNQAAADRAATGARFIEGGEITSAGLAAVLAIVERDHRVVPRCADVECERRGGHGVNHGCFDGREWVAW